MFALSQVHQINMDAALPFEIALSPKPDYDLPEVPMSFQLDIRNVGRQEVRFADPMQTFLLRFFREDSSRIALPKRTGGVAVCSMDPSNPASMSPYSWVVFKKTVEDDDRDNHVERNEYLLRADSRIAFTFDCAKVVGDCILDCVREGNQKMVYVDMILPILVPSEKRERAFFQSQRIPLGVPRP